MESLGRAESVLQLPTLWQCYPLAFDFRGSSNTQVAVSCVALARSTDMSRASVRIAEDVVGEATEQDRSWERSLCG
jgi:hypothetical protein